MQYEHYTGTKMEIKIALRANACVENMRKIEIKIALRAIVCVLVLN